MGKISVGVGSVRGLVKAVCTGNTALTALSTLPALHCFRLRLVVWRNIMQ